MNNKPRTGERSSGAEKNMQNIKTCTISALVEPTPVFMHKGSGENHYR